ncbi:MAG: ribose-phosphate pyrophosphokinase [Proteobacteria bacterium]|nr:MAG: ribose-phosphate pyrophosphokinase [Pseudomonadota bacterium]
MPFSEEDLSEALKKVGADKILTVDMDNHHLKTSPQIPLIDMDTDRLCASYFKSQGLKDLVIVAANSSVIEKVNNIKEKLEREGPRVEIGRLDSNETEVSYRGESLQGRDVILVDNIVDSGKPLYNISTYLNTLGANNIHMFATHGVINDETVDFIDYSPIKQLVITNTLQLDVSQMSSKINQISVAKIIADTIAQSSFQKNLSDLYSEGNTIDFRNQSSSTKRASL